jgi:hypothetical protein
MGWIAHVTFMQVPANRRQLPPGNKSVTFP